MAGINPDRDRQILPRWRSFEETCRLGELDSVYANRNVEDSRDPLIPKVYDWNTHNTIGHAADLVGAAIVVGQEDRAIDAAKFLLLRDKDDISPWLRELAERVLTADHSYASTEEMKPKDRVRYYRRALRDEPRDPVMYVDISRAYASLGLRDKAKKYMEIALTMEPSNRFVLRSACRLWAHLGEIDRAHYTIMKSDRTRHDPWLLAAETATSGALKRPPKLVKVARKVLADRHYSPNHLSELAAGLATVELDSGNIKKSRRLFGVSLEQPTENSVAQVAWASRRDRRIVIDDRYLDIPNTFEARSWTCFLREDWKQVVEQCHKWQSDQSFSSRPMILGSYVSAVALEDYSRSVRFADKGLIANPDDFALLNNLTFARINLGEFEAAEESMAMMKRATNSNSKRAVWLATRGLLSLRTGKVDEGRQYYLDALEIAKKEDGLLYASALSFFAVEAWNARMHDSQARVAQALGRLRQHDDPNSRLLERMLYRKARRAIDRRED